MRVQAVNYNSKPSIKKERQVTFERLSLTATSEFEKAVFDAGLQKKVIAAFKKIQSKYGKLNTSLEFDKAENITPETLLSVAAERLGPAKAVNAYARRLRFRGFNITTKDIDNVNLHGKYDAESVNEILASVAKVLSESKAKRKIEFQLYYHKSTSSGEDIYELRGKLINKQIDEEKYGWSDNHLNRYIEKHSNRPKFTYGNPSMVLLDIRGLNTPSETVGRRTQESIKDRIIKGIEYLLNKENELKEALNEEKAFCKARNEIKEQRKSFSKALAEFK